MKPFKTIIRGSNRLEVIAKDNEPHEVLLIGAVGGSFWDDSGIKESEVRDALKSIPKGKKINVRINSEGGSVQEGLGIYNAFKQRSKDITAYVDGYALSIASVLPLSASKVVSPKSAIWMIHKAWSVAQGNSDDMEGAKEMLETHDETMAEIYAEKTGKSIEKIREDMAAETWIKGSAAVEYGLADEGEDDEDGDSNAEYRALPTVYWDRVSQHQLAAAAGVRHPPTTLKELQDRLGITAMLSAPVQGAAKPPTTTITNTMKNKLVALLKKHGIEAKEDWTEDQFGTALETIEVKDTDRDTKEGAALAKQIVQMQERLDAEKKLRVTNRVNQFIDEQRLTNEEKDDAITRALKDESYLEIIAKRPSATVGSPSVSGIIELSLENPVAEIKKKHKTAKARFAAMTADWNELIVDACKRDVRSGAVKDELFGSMARAGVNPFSINRTQLPVAANTITSVLTNFLIEGSVTNLQNMWAMLRAFSLDTRPDGYKPLAPGVLKHITVGSTAQTNPTSYESGNSTVAPVTITPAEHAVSYQISNTDLNSGVRMADLVTINTAQFANVVIQAATAPITVANFGASTVISSAILFDFAALATLQAALKKSPIKHLILDGSYIARIANTPAFFQLAGTVGGDPNAWSAFGWNGIYQNTNWTGADPNVQGFACHPQAIGGIIGLPILPAVIPGNILSSSTVMVEGLDIQVLAEAWFNPATRTSWNSLRCVDGWAAVDTTAGFLITSN